MLEALIFSIISPLSPIGNLPITIASQVLTTLEQFPELHWQSPQPIKVSFQDTTLVAKAVLRAQALSGSPEVAIDPPTDWLTVAIAPGVTAYRPVTSSVANGTIASPVAQADLVWQPQSALDVNGSAIQSSLDGTRHPYLSEVSLEQLKANQIAPGRYLWSTTWEGEGYDRYYESRNKFADELERQSDRELSHHLVSQRERGKDIQVSILYDATVTDPKQPNLIISIESKQDSTAQYTNLSAFLIDPKTGETIERRDLEQLPPIYDITLTKNSGFAGTEIQECDRRCIVSFVDRVTPEELPHIFPLKIQADNQAFAQRQQELAELQAQGWIIKEVPAPGGRSE